MINNDIFETCVARAALAPSTHNTQPARWVRDGKVLSLFCDTDVGLPIADPSGRDAALSCGAVLEGMILALSAHSLSATVTLTGHDTSPNQGLIAVANLTVTEGAEDKLHEQLEQRFTWRGAFAPEPPNLFGWSRSDTRLLLDHPSRDWLAIRNDEESLMILQNKAFRQELISWMRLNSSHPRAGLDGMSRSAMPMTKRQAQKFSLGFTKLWPVLNALGRTKSLVSQRDVTLTAPIIALFHSDIHENPVQTGRAYLRLCLEAANLGFAGWPMAALTDRETSRKAIQDRFAIPTDRRLVQVIRFGVATGNAPPRARRPLSEVIKK